VRKFANFLLLVLLPIALVAVIILLVRFLAVDEKHLFDESEIFY